MHDRDLSFLNFFSRNIPENGRILEVGPFLGRSTLALYEGKKQSVTLNVIDKFEWPEIINYKWEDNINDHGSAENKLRTIEYFKNYTNFYNLFKQFIPFSDINIYQKDINECTIDRHYYSMIFIDSDHSYQGTLNAIMKLEKCHETLIIGDDANRQWPGVNHAIVSGKINLGRPLIIPRYSKLWIMPPMIGPWAEFFKKLELEIFM
jgi:hypothetical protein